MRYLLQFIAVDIFRAFVTCVPSRLDYVFCRFTELVTVFYRASNALRNWDSMGIVEVVGIIGGFL